jgi:predicted nucleic acid-binding protein
LQPEAAGKCQKANDWHRAYHIRYYPNRTFCKCAKIPQQEKLNLEAFVGICTVYNSISADIVNKTIAIRQLHKKKLPDAIIAATALVYDLILITRNTIDFKSIDGLKVIDPFGL